MLILKDFQVEVELGLARADLAGLCGFQGNPGFAAVVREEGLPGAGGEGEVESVGGLKAEDVGGWLRGEGLGLPGDAVVGGVEQREILSRDPDVHTRSRDDIEVRDGSERNLYIGAVDEMLQAALRRNEPVTTGEVSSHACEGFFVGIAASGLGAEAVGVFFFDSVARGGRLGEDGRLSGHVHGGGGGSGCGFSFGFRHGYGGRWGWRGDGGVGDESRGEVGLGFVAIELRELVGLFQGDRRGRDCLLSKWFWSRRSLRFGLRFRSDLVGG